MLSQQACHRLNQQRVDLLYVSDAGVASLEVTARECVLENFTGAGLGDCNGDCM